MQTHFKAILAAIFTTISISILPMQPQPNGSDPEQKRLAAEFQCVMSSSGQNNVGGPAQNGVGGMEPGQYTGVANDPALLVQPGPSTVGLGEWQYSPKLAEQGDAYMRNLYALAAMKHRVQDPVVQTQTPSGNPQPQKQEEIPFPLCDNNPLDPIFAQHILANNEQVSAIAARFKELPVSHRLYPRKLLMAGPSGTGKTTLAKAMATSANIPHYLYVASSIGNQWQKSATTNINRIFERHGKEQCVLIFDELQELINKSENHNDDESTALSTLWTNLDRLQNGPVCFVGILNYTKKTPEQIKTRFKQNIIEVELPNFAQRHRIIDYYLKCFANDFTFDKDVSAKILADKTEGFCCRSVTDLIDKACVTALDEAIRIKKNIDKPLVTMAYFASAIKDMEKSNKKLEPKETYGDWFSRIGSMALQALISSLIDKGVDSARTAVYNKYHGIDPIKDYKDRLERESDAYAADKEKREKDKDLFQLDMATRMAYIEQMGDNHAATEASKLIAHIKAKYKLP